MAPDTDRRRKCTVNKLKGRRRCNGRGVPSQEGVRCVTPKCSGWYCGSCLHDGMTCLLCGRGMNYMEIIAKSAE